VQAQEGREGDRVGLDGGGGFLEGGVSGEWEGRRRKKRGFCILASYL